MREFVDYNLLIAAERVRFQSDYSSGHWLHQVLGKYEQGMPIKIRRDAFEAVLRCCINAGCEAGILLAQTFPPAVGFPQYVKLEANDNWKRTCNLVLENFERHKFNRFRYVVDGD
jgi:hypothetical protein